MKQVKKIYDNFLSRHPKIQFTLLSPSCVKFCQYPNSANSVMFENEAIDHQRYWIDGIAAIEP